MCCNCLGYIFFYFGCFCQQNKKTSTCTTLIFRLIKCLFACIPLQDVAKKKMLYIYTGFLAVFETLKKYNYYLASS